jgi:hypothetical protein
MLLLNRLVDLDEMLYWGDDIEDDLDSILYNPVPSTISKWLEDVEDDIDLILVNFYSFNHSKMTFKLLRWVQILNRLVYLFEMFYVGDGIE